MRPDYSGQTFLVLGLGESGLAMIKWLSRCGGRVCVADSRSQPPGLDDLREACPQTEIVLGGFATDLLDGVSAVALSPGLSIHTPLLREARARGITITGEIELFAQALRALGERERCKILAITGTNGKTTTTTLVGELVRAAGLTCAVAGNISPAALDELMRCLDLGQLPQVWALELSSFQMETTHALNADAATVLNVTDDHLDRHASMSQYAVEKARVFEGVGMQVLNRQDEYSMAMARAGCHVLSFGLDLPLGEDDFGVREIAGKAWMMRGDEPLLPCSEMPLAGAHNVANALAALALCTAIDLPMAPMLAALKGFRGLPHRVERVAQRIDGVVFYDDSKGTNVGATLAALQGLGRKVVLIAGGDGKGQDFSPLREAFRRHARAVVLIGRDASRIEAETAGCGVPCEHASSMEDAVKIANEFAQTGDAVLLSPACASLDMFRNYAHRAEVFVAAVLDLDGVSV
ncbi:UDP-N-acetylmuramoyl-L-alanine--D-glutamate ligase [Uliginosibacterium flavum]|uniref:UDP-N-acetylmuramoylalanine--D-glutamate ligase n=1 Tax=Uliginosibacterium flavum TaxID=1396831 RepID=A0ABV2TLJ5_9RHOO